jgi:hypothetical protein
MSWSFGDLFDAVVDVVEGEPAGAQSDPACHGLRYVQQRASYNPSLKAPCPLQHSAETVARSNFE